MDQAGCDGTAIGFCWLSRNVKSQKLRQNKLVGLVIININKMMTDDDHSGGSDNDYNGGDDGGQEDTR